MSKPKIARPRKGVNRSTSNDTQGPRKPSRIETPKPYRGCDDRKHRTSIDETWKAYQVAHRALCGAARAATLSHLNGEAEVELGALTRLATVARKEIRRTLERARMLLGRLPLEHALAELYGEPGDTLAAQLEAGVGEIDNVAWKRAEELGLRAEAADNWPRTEARRRAREFFLSRIAAAELELEMEMAFTRDRRRSCGPLEDGSAAP